MKIRIFWTLFNNKRGNFIHSFFKKRKNDDLKKGVSGNTELCGQSILILCPRALKTSPILFGMLSTREFMSSKGIFSHSSTAMVHNCCLDPGFLLLTLFFSIPHRLSMGLRSGLCGDTSLRIQHHFSLSSPKRFLHDGRGRYYP